MNNENKTMTESEDAVLAAFFSEAAEIEPESLSTAAQLLWRAEVLGRFEAEDRQAKRAAWPVYCGIGIGAPILIALTTLGFLGPEPSVPEGILGWLASNPLLPTVLGLIALLGTIFFLPKLVPEQPEA